MSGYVRLHRTLLGHPAFRNDGEAMAFAWMIMRASWKPSRVRYKGQGISLQRGQLAISVRDLAEALDRPKGWVERLLTRLKSETMVRTHCETGVNVITVCNYDEYQSDQDGGWTPDGTRHRTAAGQPQDTEQRREEFKKEFVVGDDARGCAQVAISPFDLTDDLCRMAGVRNIDPQAIIRHQGIVNGWLAEGLDPETEIIPVIRQAIADADTERIHSLAFFDPIIRQARARKEAQEHGHERKARHRPGRYDDGLCASPAEAILAARRSLRIDR